MRFIFSRLMPWAAAVAVLPACWAASAALARTLPGAYAAPAGAALEWGLGNARFRPAAAFLTGPTLAFHLMMTFRTLVTSQPDINRGGKLFSWPVVYLFGILFAGGAIFLSAGGGFNSYLGGLFHEGLTAYTWSAYPFIEWFRIGFLWVAGN